MKTFFLFVFIPAALYLSTLQNVTARRAFYGDEEVPNSAENLYQEDSLLSAPISATPIPERQVIHETSTVHEDNDNSRKSEGNKNVTSSAHSHAIEGEEAETIQPEVTPVEEKITPQPIQLPPPATLQPLPLAGNEDESESSNEEIFGIFSLEQVKPGSKLKVVFRPRPKTKPAVSLASRDNGNSFHVPVNLESLDISQLNKLSKSNHKKLESNIETEEVHERDFESKPKEQSSEETAEEDEDLITTDQDPQFNLRERRPQPQTPFTSFSRKLPEIRSNSRYSSSLHRPTTSGTKKSLLVQSTILSSAGNGQTHTSPFSQNTLIENEGRKPNTDEIEQDYYYEEEVLESKNIFHNTSQEETGGNSKFSFEESPENQDSNAERNTTTLSEIPRGTQPTPNSLKSNKTGTTDKKQNYSIYDRDEKR